MKAPGKNNRQPAPNPHSKKQMTAVMENDIWEIINSTPQANVGASALRGNQLSQSTPQAHAEEKIHRNIS